MTIFKYNLIRILKDKTNIIFLIIMPVLLISFVLSMNLGQKGIVCGVVDNDNTPLTQHLISKLKENSTVKIVKEGEIQSKIVNQHVDCAIIIDSGFTNKIKNNEEINVKFYSLQETNLTMPITLSVDSYLSSARNIAAATKNDDASFNKAIEYYFNNSMKVSKNYVDDESKLVDKLYMSLGFLVMSMLFLSSFAPMVILKDKETKVIFRVLSTPISVRKYMLLNTLSFFAVSLLQITLIFTYLVIVTKIPIDTMLVNLFLTSIIFSLVCVSLGTAINGISKDRRQSGLISSLLLSPMCMLGGCWWPIDYMPELLKKISNFIPPTWAMKAFNKIITGVSLYDVRNELLILIVFSIIFLLLSSWRKTDIAK